MRSQEGAGGVYQCAITESVFACDFDQSVRRPVAST